MTPRILVLFGNVPLLGNERANIETLDQLMQRGADVLFLIRRKWTVDTIQRELTRRNLAFLCVPFFEGIRYGVGFRIWCCDVIRILGGSWALLCQIHLFRATHLHTSSAAWMLNFLPALMISRLPLVYRACDLPTLHHPLWRWVWRYTCKRASVFICDSQFIRDRIVSLGAPPNRCEVIHSPAPRRQSSTVYKSEKQVGGPLTILYVGQISEHKGVDLLIDVALSLSAELLVRFIIVGDYSWENPVGQALVQKVQARGLQDRIIFTGFVDDIEPIYAQADLHVAPSVWEEPYGITVVEAKAHGLPSVVFPSGGLMELVEHGRDGWVCDDRTVKSLEAALRYYVSHPRCLASQGKLAHDSLTTRLRVHEYGDRWAKVYGLNTLKSEVNLDRPLRNRLSP